MVRELRQIMFAPQDVAAALRVYRDAYPDFLPAGKIRVKGISRDGAVRIEMLMSYGKTDQSALFDIPADDSLRALIAACAELGVPLPRGGRKTLSGAAKGLTLTIMLDPLAREGGTEVALEQFAQPRRLIDA